MLRPNIHPGEILSEEFLKPAGLDADRLARTLRLPLLYVRMLLEGRAAVTVDTGLRLSHFFGTSDRFWLEAQLAYDLEHARASGPCLRSEITPLAELASLPQAA